MSIEQKTKELEPFNSIEEIQNAVDKLPVWSVDGDIDQYLEIMYRLSLFSKDYKVNDYNGLSGTLTGKYSSNIELAARMICASKFPGEEWLTNGQLDKLNFEKGLPVYYLAMYIKNGMSDIARYVDYEEYFYQKFNCAVRPQTLDEVLNIERTAKEYVESKPKHK